MNRFRKGHTIHVLKMNGDLIHSISTAKVEWNKVPDPSVDLIGHIKVEGSDIIYEYYNDCSATYIHAPSQTKLDAIY